MARYVADASLTSTAGARRALIGCMYAAVGTGVTYGFSIYSSALKQQFCFSQSQLANLNTVQYALGPLGAVLGAFARRCGPKGTLLLGGLWVSSAQVVFFLIATRRIATGDPASVLLCVSLFQYIGIQTITAGCFATPVLHFQRQRGLATALTKSFVGLAGAVVSQLYVLLFGVPSDDPEALNCILLWAAISLGCCVFAAVVVPNSPDESAREPRTMLRYMFVHMGVLTAVSTGIALIPNGRVHTALVPLMLALALLPLGIALAPCWDRWRSIRKDEEAASLAAAALLGSDSAAASPPTAAPPPSLPLRSPPPLLKLESTSALTTAQVMMAA